MDGVELVRLGRSDRLERSRRSYGSYYYYRYYGSRYRGISFDYGGYRFVERSMDERFVIIKILGNMLDVEDRMMGEERIEV